MKKIISYWKEFDEFLKDQLAIGLFIQCTWALISPIIHKLQGTIWTTTYISIYLIMMRSAGLVVPYFKGTHIKVAYRTIVFLNILYVAATLLYFYDQNIFLITESFLSIGFCVNSVLLGIGWDLHVINNYDKTIYENFKYVATFRDSLGGIGGYSTVIIIYYFLNQRQSMMLFIFMMLFVLLIQILNYKKHYSKMEVNKNVES